MWLNCFQKGCANFYPHQLFMRIPGWPPHPCQNWTLLSLDVCHFDSLITFHINLHFMDGWGGWSFITHNQAFVCLLWIIYVLCLFSYTVEKVLYLLKIFTSGLPYVIKISLVYHLLFDLNASSFGNLILWLGCLYFTIFPL